jgi:hypothetical protein
MSSSVKAHNSVYRRCCSETGRLRRVIMCPPACFQITKPINDTQWGYFIDGLPKPDARTMVAQHPAYVDAPRSEGVEVELLPPVKGLPYQHAMRDVGFVVGDTFIVSRLKRSKPPLTGITSGGHALGQVMLRVATW